MSFADRWLLPDGVEEILPASALHIEAARRQLLDLYDQWGYDLVMPPMIEYTDSLLIGLGQDIDLLTFRVTDQLSGRMMGIRADITPQIARMDAHSFAREGINRLCYAGHVLHTKPKTPMATRTPIQAGVELFGEASLNADIEVISLMLESLATLAVPQLHMDLGHISVYHGLAKAAGLSDQQEQQFFDLLQQKSAADIAGWVATNVTNDEHKRWFLALPELAGGLEIVAQAKQVLSGAPSQALAAIAELESVAQHIQARWPDVEIYCDLSEVRGYNYHTGIVFAAFSPGFGGTIARGGRYDHIGQVFGRSRPAIGFTVDISTVMRLIESPRADQGAIFAPWSCDVAQWSAVQALRARGRRVVCALSEGEQAPADCTEQLIHDQEQGKFTLKPL